ncbi:MAG: phosphopentomutase [Clostridiales bacterium]|jgi:phosphopentomutase|nr:phosphopentomutase [Clostridiales bacterium]
MKRRVVLIVLDSVGIGALPDAHLFSDTGAHTLGNIYKISGGLDLPNMYSMGLSEIEDSRLPKFDGKIIGAFGRAAEKSSGKDTTSGHWELMGVISEKGFKTYTENGFPAELIEEFENRIGSKTLGNYAASGTEIIQVLGAEHQKTGFPIVYTSADSVLQIAAHENTVSLERLYMMCKIARELIDEGGYNIARVIARPFVGNSESGYTRTPNRRDYSVEPPSTTVLDKLLQMGYVTVGVGKIDDIFAGRGVAIAEHSKNNKGSIDATIRYLKSDEGDFIFTNLVDFDMLYGHRNDYEGYRNALEYFDYRLPEVISAMKDNDLLIITADHGCDPTFPGTDHTREYIPILVYNKRMTGAMPLGTVDSFMHVGGLVFNFLTTQAL